MSEPEYTAVSGQATNGEGQPSRTDLHRATLELADLLVKGLAQNILGVAEEDGHDERPRMRAWLERQACAFLRMDEVEQGRLTMFCGIGGRRQGVVRVQVSLDIQEVEP